MILAHPAFNFFPGNAKQEIDLTLPSVGQIHTLKSYSIENILLKTFY